MNSTTEMYFIIRTGVNWVVHLRTSPTEQRTETFFLQCIPQKHHKKGKKLEPLLIKAALRDLIHRTHYMYHDMHQG